MDTRTAASRSVRGQQASGGTDWTPLRRVIRSGALAATRGVALFFGGFSLANALGLLFGTPSSEDVWWIDLHSIGVGGYAEVLLLAVSAALLVAWGLAPRAGAARRWATATAAAALAAAALGNTYEYYVACRPGAWVSPSASFPSSLVVAAVLGLVAACTACSRWTAVRGRVHGAMVVVTVAALAVLFPLMHIAFFGTTDYRRPADAAVILGAKVHESGRLSTVLEDRVLTGVDLYQAGLVDVLVMSGGVGWNGVDEALAMRDRAIELGVPSEDILVDSDGVNTDATVRDTVAIFEREGIEDVLVVSQDFHLPRIKMAYRAAGWNVCTVPALQRVAIPQRPYLIAREVGGFWVYWARSLLG